MSTPLVGPAAYKLEPSKLAALNLMLHRYGGAWQGQPLFKLSWAADDNPGLVDSAVLDTRLPVCFDEHQFCYHLLSFRPPASGDFALAHETGENPSRGMYECTGLHFFDSVANQPVDPTETIIEHILPVLRSSSQAALAAWSGYKAAVEHERARRAAWRERERAERERADDRRADAILAATELSDAETSNLEPSRDPNGTAFDNHVPVIQIASPKSARKDK